MTPVPKITILASATPTILVSEHSATQALDAASQMVTIDTTLETGENALMEDVPEHVTHGQDPDGQSRRDYRCLGNLLRNCGIEHADCTQETTKLFWPTPLLEQILTSERIVEELEAPTQTGLTLQFDLSSYALAELILDGRIRIFAILLLLDQVQYIECAVQEGLVDSDLPFKLFGRNQLYRTSRDQRLQLVKCFSDPKWKIHDREIFTTYQEAVNPRILEWECDTRTVKHVEFPSKAVLPFMYEARKGVRKRDRQYGGFGVVSVVKIHPACHNFQALLKSIDTEDGFALKRLQNDDIGEFKKEAGILAVFNGYAHPHIVTLLMTWKQNGSYFLLFPLARYDLDKHWETTPNETDVESLRWMSRQLLGISSAIASIHDPPSNGSRRNIGASGDNLQVPHDENKYGRHGDLKPENILLFDSPHDAKGILVVADFGLSRLNSILSRSVQSNSRVPATPRYKPPECDISGAKIKRSYDVWTFGCLALEWVCWLFGGQSARELFISSLLKPYPSGTRKDMFFDMVWQQGETYHSVIKKEVEEKFAELHQDPKCTQYIHELLDLIEERTIVTRAEHRIDAKALLDRLATMDDVRDADYYAVRCPRPHVRKPQDPLLVVFRRTKT